MNVNDSVFIELNDWVAPLILEGFRNTKKTDVFSGKLSGKHSGNMAIAFRQTEKEKRNLLCFKKIPLVLFFFEKSLLPPERFSESNLTEQSVGFQLEQLDILDNQRQSLFVGCVTLIQTYQPLIILILKMTFKD